MKYPTAVFVRPLVFVISTLSLVLTSQNVVASGDLKDELIARKQVIEVALGRAQADTIVSNATILNVFTSEWLANQDIVITGKRIAWVGPLAFGQVKLN